DYCDVFLTHDSTSVRKAHNSGRNHLQNVRDYYASINQEQIQSMIDTIAKQYEEQSLPKPSGLITPSPMVFGSGPLSGGGE
ncbi:hypothetical protein IE53DRAFT_317366, partial [Violaceomyces palustris]